MQTQAEKVKDYTASRLKRLAAQGEHSQKASLANLRRGVGKRPGELPALWGEFLQDLPADPQSQDRKANPTEWAVYTALTLYAVHQQGHALPQENMNRKGIGLGSAVRRLAESRVKVEEEVENSSISKRFNRLATAADMPELLHHLRGIVQLLSAEGIPLDYAQLAEDLYCWQCPEDAAEEDNIDKDIIDTKLQWGREFYRKNHEEQKGESP